MREGFHQNEGEDIKLRRQRLQKTDFRKRSRGRGGGWIPRITSEILHRVTEVRRMARVTKGEMAGCSPGQRRSQARLEQLRPPDKSP